MMHVADKQSSVLARVLSEKKLCFFYKQKTAYEVRMSDWSSDACSSDLGALAAWAGGTRADAAEFGPARLEFTGDGHLARIEQDGWTIDYLGWAGQDPGDAGSPLQLPDRINAERGEAKVRLAIDAWSWAPETPRSEEHTSELQSLM